MPPGDLNRFTPDAAQAGANVARTLRVIAKVFLDWCNAEGGRVDVRRRNKAEIESSAESTTPIGMPHLTAIYFDKLVTAFSRIWDELHKQGDVDYFAALYPMRGFHGPGRVLSINRTEEDRLWLEQRPEYYRRSNYAYATEVVSKLTPSFGRARILFRVKGDPRSHTCQVHPELDESLWDSWTSDSGSANEKALFLSAVERRYTEALSTALARLDKEQVRALGTHCSADETCRDIEFNRAAWKRNFDSLGEFLTTGEGNAEKATYRLVVTSREIVKKSGGNRRHYREAAKIVWDTLGPCPAIQKAFKAVHQTDKGIWDDPRVEAYSRVAPTLLDMSLHIRGGLLEHHGAGKLAKKELKECAEANERLGEPSSQVAESVWPNDEIRTRPKTEWWNQLCAMKDLAFRRMPRSEDLADSGVP